MSPTHAAIFILFFFTTLLALTQRHATRTERRDAAETAAIVLSATLALALVL